MDPGAAGIACGKNAGDDDGTDRVALGRRGDTDPDGLIPQHYAQEEESGGFLEVAVRPGKGEKPATVEFAFYDEHGALLYRTQKAARP